MDSCAEGPQTLRTLYKRAVVAASQRTSDGSSHEDRPAAADKLLGSADEHSRFV